MGARIFRLADHCAEVRFEGQANHSDKAAAQAGSLSRAAVHSDRYCLWMGASGQKYVHSVFSLVECPEVSAANYVLVRRSSDGTIAECRVGRVDHDTPSLNLAEIRHKGAIFGATEVHVHLLADTVKRGKLIAFDIESGRSGTSISSDMRH